MSDALTTVSELQRASLSRALDTLRARHNQMVADLTKLPVPPSPSLYDSRGDKSWLLDAQKSYVRSLIAAMKPVLERVADDAADYCGARIENVEIFDATTEDFLTPLDKAAQELLEPVEP